MQRMRLILGMISLVIAASPSWADGPDAAPSPAGDYLLQPGDTIKVQVFQEPDLDRELMISVEGEVFLPLIGRLVVKDRTIRQVEETVRVLYDRKYLVNPQVNITVTKYRVRTVNVLGAVNSPQAITYPPEQPLTLLDAISRAGGFNRYANRKAVRLTRTFPDGHTENFTIDADALIQGNKGEPWVLLSGDVIFVPESIL
jgi:polysaccharide export outer membrane protein